MYKIYALTNGDGCGVRIPLIRPIQLCLNKKTILIYCENNDFSMVRVASPNWYPSFPDSRPEHSFQESVYIIFLVASVATFPNICSPDVCGWRSSVEVAIVGSFVF